MCTLLMGIDVGTTGSKVLLIDERGEVVASADSGYPMRSPRPLWAEQDPEDWWHATVASIRTVLEKDGIVPKRIAGIGLTGQMHGLVLLDAKGEVLRPCIMWNDQRTAEECSELTSIVGVEAAQHITGKPILPNFTAPKILWVRKHEQRVYEKIAHILLPKDYIRFRLTGSLFSEVSDASGTSLFDVGRRYWSEEMIAAAGVKPSWLPEATESPVASAKISAEAARITGLREGTPVVAGGGDQAAQAIGTGIVEEGTISATIGTSGVMFATTDNYKLDPKGGIHSYCHAVPGKWHVMGVMLSAAGSLRWFRDALCGDLLKRAEETGRDAYELIDEEAAGVAPGCEGLFFLPYLTGERTPHADPNARGVFFGLTLRHGRAQMARAVLEGVAYGLRDALNLMRELGLPINEVRVSGGGARSSLWCHIIADNFESDLLTVNVTEGAAFGAALLAGVGTEIFRDVAEACKATIKVTGRMSPGNSAAVYRRFYPRSRAIYQALKAEFAELAKMVDE
jgi:xylulokinase